MSKRSAGLVMDVGEEEQVGVRRRSAASISSRGGDVEAEAGELGGAAGDMEVGVEIAGLGEERRPVRTARRRRRSA